MTNEAQLFTKGEIYKAIEDYSYLIQKSDLLMYLRNGFWFHFASGKVVRVYYLKHFHTCMEPIW